MVASETEGGDELLAAEGFVADGFHGRMQGDERVLKIVEMRHLTLETANLSF